MTEDADTTLPRVEQFSAKLQELDPNKLVISDVKAGDRPNRVQVTMTQAFHAAPYQERLQLVQAMGKAWGTVSRLDLAMVIITDKGGNVVGRGGMGLTEVEKY